jgi:hypothetical protein
MVDVDSGRGGKFRVPRRSLGTIGYAYVPFERSYHHWGGRTRSFALGARPSPPQIGGTWSGNGGDGDRAEAARQAARQGGARPHRPAGGDGRATASAFGTRRRRNAYMAAAGARAERPNHFKISVPGRSRGAYAGMWSTGSRMAITSGRSKRSAAASRTGVGPCQDKETISCPFLLDWKRFRFLPREAAGKPRHSRRAFASRCSVPGARRTVPQPTASDMRGSRSGARHPPGACASAPFSPRP